MPKLKVSLSIGFPGACRGDVIEIDDDEWEACDTDEKKEDLINEYWADWSNNYIDGGASLVE
jgi:hypothetical protein